MKFHKFHVIVLGAERVNKMARMEERLDGIVERYHEINDLMMQPEIVSDRKEMAKLGREQNEITPVVETYEAYKKMFADKFLGCLFMFFKFRSNLMNFFGLT